MSKLIVFIRESNAIEGILRDPTEAEIAAHEKLLALPKLELGDVIEFQAVIAPGKPIRAAAGMNVRVGNHIAPPGGPLIVDELRRIIDEVNISRDPWGCHVRLELTHPFLDGNGRTGRAIWAWQMTHLGRDPFALPFLHRAYYQALEGARCA
jgi:hypothetical protein